MAGLFPQGDGAQDLGVQAADSDRVDWVAVLDQLEEAIEDGGSFEAPSGSIPSELIQRAIQLDRRCAERISDVEAEIGSVGAELSQLAGHSHGGWFRSRSSDQPGDSGLTRLL